MCINRPSQRNARLQKMVIVFDNISRKRMQDGINKIADAVAVTLGPRGKFFKLLLPFSYTSFYLLCIQHANSKYIVSILLQFI